jgi:hypothetical protein
MDHILFNSNEANDHLKEAMTRLRKCVYVMKLEDKTVGQLLDESNHLGYSIIGDMATLKALQSDLKYLIEQRSASD